MHFNRRKFISSSSLAFLGIALSNNFVIQSLDLYLNKNLEETIPEKLKRAAELRRGILNSNEEVPVANNMRSATGNFLSVDSILQIYQEILAIKPDEMRAHDGIRRAMLLQKYQELQVFNYFHNLYNQQPSNMKLKERLANEYRRLAQGNKKFGQEIGASQSGLLSLSKTSFSELLIADPQNKQYQAEYEKSERLTVQGAVSEDPRTNPKIKEQRRLNRIAYKSRFNNMTSAEVKVRLDKLLSKKISQDRSHHIREVYKIYIEKLVDEKNIDKAALELNKLISFDTSDYNSLFLMRSICNKYGKFSDLERVERENVNRKKTFWSKVALFDVLLRKYKYDKSSSLQEMKDLLSNTSQDGSGFTKNFEIQSRNVKLNLAQGNYTIVYNLLELLADKISNITSAHWIDRFNRLCVDYYRQSNSVSSAIQVLNIALKINDSALGDSLLIKINKVNKSRETDKAIHNERIIYLRNQLSN